MILLGRESDVKKVPVLLSLVKSNYSCKIKNPLRFSRVQNHLVDSDDALCVYPRYELYFLKHVP